jgi:NAD(P)-dependent dehydrogenase (short-subunit alcohol dehydrogenase family)
MTAARGSFASPTSPSTGADAADAADGRAGAVRVPDDRECISDVALWIVSEGALTPSCMKNVLITGCSSGYGCATAAHFLEKGWNVVATMRSPGKRRDALPASERLRVLALDVTDRGSIDAAVGEAIGALGGLDVVVNNAGIGLLSAFEATPDPTIREIFETNVFGAMAVAQAVVPHFRERRAGVLVNVTSSVGIVPMPMTSVYSASKLAMEGFSESLAYELSAFGVRVKIVEPGYGPGTQFTENGMKRMQALEIPSAYKGYAEKLMGGMTGNKTTSAPEVAAAVLLAATDGSSRLRYPAGGDAEDLAAMRRAMPGDDYLAAMFAAIGPERAG